MSREVIRRTLPKKTPKGMVEMFTTPREKEANVVKSILRKASIKYKSQEEDRSNGWRYCIYVPHQSSKRAYKVIDEGLLERDM
jgi:hypothetical protein